LLTSEKSARLLGAQLARNPDNASGKAKIEKSKAESKHNELVDMIFKHGDDSYIIAQNEEMIWGRLPYLNQRGENQDLLMVFNKKENSRDKLMGTGIYFFQEDGGSYKVENGEVKRDPYGETFDMVRTYYLDTKDRWETVHAEMVNNNWDRNDVIPGAALLCMAAEQVMGATDSSGTTFRIRNNGTLAPQGREKQGAAFSSESTVTSFSAGHSLPGRLQKALRVDVGPATTLIAVGTAAVRLTHRGLSDEDKRLAKQCLETGIQHAQRQFHYSQANVLSGLSGAMDAKSAMKMVSCVASSMTAIPPRQNKPVLIHPCVAVKNLKVMLAIPEDKGIYDLSIIDKLDWKINLKLVPGFKDSKGVTQALAMAACNNLYGHLELNHILFDEPDAFKTRDEIAHELSKKLTGMSSDVKLSGIGKATKLSSFSKEAGTESNHQAALIGGTKIKGGEIKPFVHRMSNPVFTNLMASSQPYMNLVATLRDSTKLDEVIKELRGEDRGTCPGEIPTADQTKGYFNTITIQTEAQRKAVLDQWGVFSATPDALNNFLRSFVG
jgi:hypothetical protein